LDRWDRLKPGTKTEVCKLLHVKSSEEAGESDEEEGPKEEVSLS
jgi:hypothetical protein